MILAASVTTIIAALLISGILTHPQPKFINETNHTGLFTSTAQPVIRNEYYLIVNSSRGEPCKDDPGVICFVPFQEKPLPPKVMRKPPE
jgi:hypothetical protein